MKKFLVSIVVFICGLNTIFAQIPNPGFENWIAGEPEGWSTSNAPGAGLVNITQTSDEHGGSFALQGDVVNFFGTPMGPIIQTGPGGGGFPIAEAYQAVELYYKFTPVGGDKFSVNIAFEKDGNPIAQGAVAIPTTVTGYTFLSVPMTYSIVDLPDNAIIQISITGPVSGSDYHIGSVMYVDDLSFPSTTGICDTPVKGIAGNCYPNPASGIVNIPINENLSGELNLRVFNNCGKEVKSITCHQQDGNEIIQSSVENLSNGLFLYSIDGQGKHFSGKFYVCR
jgi:hypothetical protein